MQIFGNKINYDQNIRDAVRLREQTLSKAAVEQHQQPQVLSDKDIDKLSHGDLERYWASDPSSGISWAGPLAAGQLEAAGKTAAVRNRVFATVALGVGLALAGPIAGVPALVVAAGVTMGAAIFQMKYHDALVRDPQERGSYSVGEIPRFRASADRHTNNIKHELATKRLGDAPQAEALRKQDLDHRSQMLAEARMVDPNVTVASLFSNELGYLFSAR